MSSTDDASATNPKEILRTPKEWGFAYGIRVLDPDGWRGKDGRPFEDPITREEYDRRVVMSTIMGIVHDMNEDEVKNDDHS